jgi:predicted ABC-type ATPase
MPVDLFAGDPRSTGEIRLSANRIVVDVIPLFGRVSNRAARHIEGARALPGLEAQATQIWSRADQSADKRAARQAVGWFAWCNVRPTVDLWFGTALSSCVARRHSLVARSHPAGFGLI